MMTESNPPSQQPAIALDQVSRVYRTHGGIFTSHTKPVVALNKVNLIINPGRIFGLVGESGSGKSTAARLIVGLEKPNEGHIRILGEEIESLGNKKLKAFRRKVQMIFQDPYQSLNPYQSVAHIVGEPLLIHKWGDRQTRLKKILDTLSMVGIHSPEECLFRHPHQLSGGQRQRVSIARAMILDPQVVVADEPTSMLDASISIQIFQVLADIRKQRRVTILFITHSLAAAHYLCDDIAVLYRGHIVETGPAKKVISNPRHPYTQALLDALPRYGHWNRKHRFNTLRHPELSDPGTGCPFYSKCMRAEVNKCSHDRPPLRDLEDQHQAACFFA